MFIKKGCGPDFLINILLTLLGAIPGILHAWWIVFVYNDVDGYRVLEEGGYDHAREGQVRATIPRPVVNPPQPQPYQVTQ